MNLYAAYIKGALLDQVPGENEDTALATLRMDYPKLEGTVELQLIDNNYKPQEVKKLAAVSSVEDTVTEGKNGTRPFAVIEADKVELHITVASGVISAKDIAELEKAAEEGLVIAKGKGN